MTDNMRIQQNREVNVNWLRINVPSVISILIAGISIAMYVQKLSGDLDALTDTVKSQTVMTDRNFDQIQARFDPLINVPYRVSALEQNLASTNQRVDQYLQVLGTKLDSMSDRVNSLVTKVEVLSQRIDALTPPGRRVP